MTGLEIYLLFMVSVGVWSCYELMRPARAILSITDPNDVLVKSPITAYIVQFCIGAVFAPFMFWVILIPAMYGKALDGLTKR